jgi:hypothetical protein
LIMYYFQISYITFSPVIIGHKVILLIIGGLKFNVLF